MNVCVYMYNIIKCISIIITVNENNYCILLVVMHQFDVYYFSFSSRQYVCHQMSSGATDLQKSDIVM